MNGSVPSNPRQHIGRRFAKTFLHDDGPQLYEGTVTGYDDGDEEEMLWEDLEQCLI